MNTKDANSEGNFATIVDGLVALPLAEFKSSLKDLPEEIINAIKEVKTLSHEQVTALSEHLNISQKPAVSSVNDGYIPLKNRLRSWWSGDDAKFKKSDTQGSVDTHVPRQHDPRRWNPTSINISQELWGAGFIQPGGEDFAKKLLSAFKFNSSNAVLDLTAGLGGTATVLARDHNLWLDAYEHNEELFRVGQEFLNRKGMAKKVPLQHLDLENLSLPEKKYDQIYSRESLFMMKNKKNIIQQIAKALKRRGQVIIVDYMLAENHNLLDLKEWRNLERQPVHLWTSELYENACSHYGMSVWSVNDFSEEYLAEIHQGWHDISEKINSGNLDRNFVDYLLHEGNVWLHRANAIKSGALVIKRIHAVV